MSFLDMWPGWRRPVLGPSSTSGIGGYTDSGYRPAVTRKPPNAAAAPRRNGIDYTPAKKGSLDMSMVGGLAIPPGFTLPPLDRSVHLLPIGTVGNPASGFADPYSLGAQIAAALRGGWY